MRRFSLLFTVFAVVAAGMVVMTANPTPAMAIENGLARTPPMGFNNWNFTHCDSTFNETQIRAVADSFVSNGLRDVGFTYVNIDDCWALPQRNAQGNLVPDPARFPSGIKALADYVHARGLKFGIYTSAGTKTCNTAGFPGGLGHEQQDANLFASWGVDYLKYDNCNNQGVDAIQRYTAMRDALAATGRPIMFSICEWGQSTPKVWTWGAGMGNLWRTTGDISDNWSSMISRVHTNDDLAQYAGPGHWNDPDMLEVGNGGMTDTEYRSHFSLWAMMSAPMLIGSDIRNPSAATLNILRNTDVIALDQDPLGRQATIVSSSGGLVVYAKPLSNGDFAVALLNETGATATVSTTTAAIGLSGSASLKDLWSKQVRTTTGAISASVPSHGTVVYRVTRTGAAAPPNGTSQLSDRAALSATNGWGPVELDRSVNGQAAGDGGTLTIGGTTYAKGLGTHASSSVTYQLGGRCSAFTTDVGVDDETTAGRVVFQVWLDGRKVADSGYVTGSQGATRLTADLTGATTLLLAVTDGGDGIASDHADWANPQITCSGGGATTSVEAEAAGNTFAGQAASTACATCSGGAKVRFIGNGTANTLTLNNITAASAGSRQLTVQYTVDGTRSFFVSVNGGTAVQVSCTGTSWATPVTTTVNVTLVAGTKTLRFFNDTAWAPDLDVIAIS